MMSADEEESSTSDEQQRPSPATQNQSLGLNGSVPSKRWMSGAFVRLLATNMSFGFSVSCFYLLPKHLTVRYAATPGEVGAVMGIFGLTCVLIVPWLGRWINALGLRRALTYSFLLLAASSLAFVLPDHVGIGMLLLRTLQGLATAGVMTAGVAMACELAPPQKLAHAMGLAGAASLIMNAIAPAVAEPIGAAHGFSWVFALSGVAALIGVWLARGLPIGARQIQTEVRTPLSRKSVTILAAMALSGAGFNVVMAFLAPLALSRHMDVVRGFFVAYTVAALCVRIFGGRMTEWLGLRRTAMLSLLGYGTSIVAIAGLGPKTIVLLGLGFGLAHGALFPSLMALLMVDVEPAARTRLASYSNGVLNLGMLSVTGFGLVANHAGLVAVFISTGALMAASAWILFSDRLRKSASPARFADAPERDLSASG
jgi:predicted MFS family arabinose efflux permease